MSFDGGGLEEYLSDEVLMEITGTRDFASVTKVEMFVDTHENSLSALGSKLPNLRELKLSHSVIASLRDLGTGLRNLQVLWVAHCQLSDLDGIAALPNLRELYAAYNDIADISPIADLEHLEVLDIEGCNVEDPDALSFLTHIQSLHTLSAAGNPMVTSRGVDVFKQKIREFCPHVDDVEASIGNSGLSSNELDSEATFLRDAIKYSNLGVMVPTSSNPRPPSAMSSPASAGSSTPLSARPMSARGGARPMSARPGSARPMSAMRGNLGSPSSFAYGPQALRVTPEDDSSELTFGTTEVFCGNPVKSLRNRKLENAPSPTSSGNGSPGIRSRVGRHAQLQSSGSTAPASAHSDSSPTERSIGSSDNLDLMEALRAQKTNELLLMQNRAGVGSSHDDFLDDCDDTIEGFIYDDDDQDSPHANGKQPLAMISGEELKRRSAGPIQQQQQALQPANVKVAPVQPSPAPPTVLVGRMRPGSSRALRAQQSSPAAGVSL